ncbi:hypothetical protein [Paramaledivibacter caminithermalis]|jgi:hypothetical protein|uniref:Uncharacterized protein n=1 Tax=Paramaledivibacter caminithermalis (strain DSM 15212 / CIP 107654 / DViRD3) TaxID=1121301 RepID=A0A1M6T160_PARC5|nr:hypothetical protein [Paramaledivibacter caminithermalis]SHK50674.1 hypothetical protein SAMN02745912_03517 [Paramaledivibacter caminithermalis DSM 15212]
MIKARYIVLYSIIVVTCLLICILFFDFDKNKELTKPDKIIVFYNDSIIEVKNDSKQFDTIYDLTVKRIKSSSFFGETAIESEILEKIKKEIAIEFVYFNTIEYRHDSIKREFNKLFISLGSEYNDYIIFYNNRYQSSPLENLKKPDELKKYVLDNI